jgi:Carboxypeptidase regulatory-like domain
MRLETSALLSILTLAVPPAALVLQAAQVPAGAGTGVIIGTVTDESGHPFVVARVQAVDRRKKWAGPYYETAAGVADDSDDRGQFRLHSLPPGEYVVAVSVAPKKPTPTPAALSDATGYLRTYNPGTSALADAWAVAR